MSILKVTGVLPICVLISTQFLHKITDFEKVT